ncbi:MAG: hypothetical protein HLUCCO18_01715 [Rhodobacteraceae bacterium HLUCCO18]|nr:MAG: hypothetical protein HLUCCO18_01715 [Rhodobacteraceae bacterium HLUCCO18]
MVSALTKRIDRDLFAGLMRMPARERTDILEFLGQSPVDPDASGVSGRLAEEFGEQADLRPIRARAIRT